MKFKNFQNSYTSDNRIYSNEELYNMPLNKLVSMEKELGAQYGSIGFPMESELRQSENVVYVHAYTRDDGTSVKAHWRSKPDNSKNEGAITGGASEPEIKQKDINNKNDKIYINQEKLRELGEEKYKALYPDEIAGVKRGKEMSFEDVIRKGVNPNYEDDIENNRSNGNCNSCVAAYEYCRRGYNVNAGTTYNNSKCEELMHNGLDLWIEPNSGKIAEWTEIDINTTSTFDYLQKTIQPGERYELGIYPQLIENQPETIEGHAIIVEKDDNNQLLIYDPQKREFCLNSIETKMYLYSWVDAPEAITEVFPKVLRIDNKKINPYYEGILVP